MDETTVHIKSQSWSTRVENDVMTDLTMIASSEREPEAVESSAGAESAITTEGLVRTFDGVQAVDGLDLDIHQGRDLRLPRAERRRQDHDRARAVHAARADVPVEPTVAGHDVATDPGAVRLRIGVALQEVALDPKQTGAELLRLQGRLYGLSRAETDQRRVSSSASSSTSATRSAGASAPTRAGCAAGSTWLRRSSTTRTSCSSTSPRPASTRSAERGCGRRSAGSTGSSA